MPTQFDSPERPSCSASGGLPHWSPRSWLSRPYHGKRWRHDKLGLPLSSVMTSGTPTRGDGDRGTDAAAPATGVTLSLRSGASLRFRTSSTAHEWTFPWPVIALATAVIYVLSQVNW